MFNAVFIEVGPELTKYGCVTQELAASPKVGAILLLQKKTKYLYAIVLQNYDEGYNSWAPNSMNRTINWDFFAQIRSAIRRASGHYWMAVCQLSAVFLIFFVIRSATHSMHFFVTEFGAQALPGWPGSGLGMARRTPT